ncbi:MAG TPA: glycosyltransferase, partial [Solirubrobacteraceae bacterium]
MRVRGKLLVAGEAEVTVRGVTYGTFRRRADGTALPPRERVERDLAAMAAAGVTAVRTYEPPPAWFLDDALAHGLRVMVGLPWEQHVAFLGDRATARSIRRRVADGVRACAGHPAVLCYAVGNEVPAPIVRWHGHRAVEAFIERLAAVAKDEDPAGLVTYVNFPTTEYLRLPFLDLVCFNVYLAAARDLESYLARLHTIAGDRPLLMAELGLDSRRHGALEQARSLERQLDVTFAAGCAGAFVFAWTDEWHRGGFDVEDWDFGLVTRDRRPKPALAAVTRAFRRAADAEADAAWPRISVVVCTHNGERWLPGCFDALERVRYPDWEVIVVNDGSRDRTDELVRERGWRLVRSVDNIGLSAARNLGWQAATGEIVAYLDDDARPEPRWLRNLARAFLRRPFAAVGGPNLPPPDDGFVASCVAHAPGGPAHVLLSDDVAEHVPGCNMAIRRDGLEAIGGFDPCFRIAGDDVDVCWRLQAEGLTVGFSPAAVVWHHRRNSVRAYLRQQFHYGRAEGLLERKWP